MLLVYPLVPVVAKAEEPKRENIGDSAEQQGALEVKSVVEKPALPKWLYLAEQAHPRKKQLFVKGRKLPAAAVWTGMIANDLSVQEATENSRSYSPGTFNPASL